MGGIDGVAFTRGWPTAAGRQAPAPGDAVAGRADRAGDRPALGTETAPETERRQRGLPLGALHTGDWLRSDRSWGDFPLDDAGRPTHPDAFSPGQERLLETASRLSNEALFRILALELSVFGHGLGAELVERYRQNDASEMRAGPDSAFAQAIRSDPEGRRVIERIETRLQNALQYQLDTRGELAASDLRVGVTGEELAYWGPNPLNPLSGAYGGIQGLELELIELDYDPARRRVEAVLGVDMLDTFGVGHDDFDSAGQIAMWILQHQRGIAPFPTRTELVVETGFTLDPLGAPRGGPMHHPRP